MKKEHLKLIGNLVLIMIALFVGAPSGIMMAQAVALPEGGAMAASGVNGEGALTIAKGSDASPGLYLNAIDERITKVRPMATPIDQISRYAKAISIKSMEVKYYTIDTRPIRTKLTTAITAQTTGMSCPIVLENPEIMSIDDTIRVVGVKGFKDGGTEKSAEDLVLYVVSLDSSTSNPSVSAVNGKKNSNGQPTLLPAIPAGTVFIRMGKACAELDAQTSAFSNVPTAEIQYCQNFMMQVEEGTLEKLADKEVDFNLSDLEEQSIFDMRMGQENTFLFGALGKQRHAVKNSQSVYFTQGIYWQAGKDIEVGVFEGADTVATITDDELVDITKELFTGVGSGNRRKVLVAGSELLAAFSKIKSEKFRLKDSVEAWNLKFKSFDSDFGEVLVIHSELFDLNGMADKGLCIDPEYITKYTFVPLGRNVLDLKKAGVRNSDAIVMQEVSCLCLRHKKAHARISLAKKSA